MLGALSLSCQFLQCSRHLAIQQPQHSHTVLQLRIIVIALRFRQLTPRQQVPFVAGMDKVSMPALPEFSLPAFNNLQCCFRGFFIKGLKRIKPLPKPGKSDRNHRHAFHHRQIFCQIPNRPFQFFPVVDSPAKYDLAIHRNLCRIEPVYLFERLPGKTVVQHLTAQTGIRRVDRNIDRRQLKPDNPLNIMVFHISQGNIIPLQKG